MSTPPPYVKKVSTATSCLSCLFAKAEMMNATLSAHILHHVLIVHMHRVSVKFRVVEQDSLLPSLHCFALVLVVVLVVLVINGDDVRGDRVGYQKRRYRRRV
jgi:hypothetical protein